MNNPSNRKPGFTLIELLVGISIIIVLAALLFTVTIRMKERAVATGCTSNIRQCIIMCNMFAGEQNGYAPRLHVTNHMMRSFAGKDPLPVEERIVNNSAVNWWPDQLTTYEQGAGMFCCPKLKTAAVNGPGGGKSTRCPLGIGINYNVMAPNDGADPPNSKPFSRVLLSNVPDQSRMVWFADAGGDVTGDWNKRTDVPGYGSCFFRGRTSEGKGAIARHDGRISIGFVDGHVELLKPAEINWGPRDKSRRYAAYTMFPDE